MAKLALKIKLLTPTAKMPTRAHEGDLYDIYADEDKEISSAPTLVSTGLAFDIPEGYQVRIYNRSSNPLKYGLILGNSVGIIDTHYKDEVKGIFYCADYIATEHLSILQPEVITYRTIKHRTHVIHKGDKIMQMELVKINDFDVIETQELDKTNDRGGGFGSTGN